MKKYLQWKYFERFMSVVQFLFILFGVVFIIFLLRNSLANKDIPKLESNTSSLKSTSTYESTSTQVIEDDDVFNQRRLRADENEKINSVYYP